MKIIPWLAAVLAVSVPSALLAAVAPPFQLEWGGPGTGPGQFLSPAEIAVSPTGLVYVTDFSGDRVQEFDLVGELVRAWGTNGTGPGQFRGPTGVALDVAGNVYVVDQSNLRIQKFTTDGTYLSSFGHGFPFLSNPNGIAVGATGDVYVVDSGHNAIVQYDGTGSFVRSWGSLGSAPGQFMNPQDLAIGPDGDIYVADFSNSRVQTFSPSGMFLSSFSVFEQHGEFAYPWGIGVDASDNVYVSLNGNFKIREYTNAGTVLATWGGVGSTPGLFIGPKGIAFDAVGSIYIVDSGNYLVQRFGTVGPPDEVASLAWTAPDTLQWTSATGATSYALARGNGTALPGLLDQTADSCHVADTTLLSVTGIAEQPNPGEFYWYLVRGQNDAGPGNAGNATAGPRILNTMGICQ